MINPLPSRLLLLIASLSCLLFVALACGDDDDGGSTNTPLTLEQYFVRLEPYISEYAATNLDEYPGGFESLVVTVSYYHDLTQLMRGALDEMVDLEAPPEAESEHGNLVAAGEIVYSEILKVQEEIMALEDDVALKEWYSNFVPVSGLLEASQDVEESCRALQDIADTNSIDVDLLCEQVNGPTDLLLLGQYFFAVEEIFAQADEATGEAETALSEGTSDATFEEQKDAIDTYLTEIESIFSDTANQLRALNVPEQVQDPQFDFISAVEDMIDSATAFQQNLEGIDDAEHLDIRRADFGEELNGAVERADAACSELSRIATEARIVVDLGCE